MNDGPVEGIGPGAHDPGMEARVAVLEEIARSTKATLERIEGRFDKIDDRFERLESRLEGRFDKIDARFDRLERRIDQVQSDQRSDFRWLLGIMFGMLGVTLGIGGGLFAMIAHSQHWF